MTDLGNFDLIVVGGGVNGAGIARDATGRGLSTLLVEKDDIAQGTSSRSGKLVRGGLRYLVRPDHGEVSMRLPDVRVQTRGSPIKVAGQSGDGAQGRNRTTDTAIFSRMLYQLSYLGSPHVDAHADRGLIGRWTAACPVRPRAGRGRRSRSAATNPPQSAAHT